MSEQSSHIVEFLLFLLHPGEGLLGLNSNSLYQFLYEATEVPARSINEVQALFSRIIRNVGSEWEILAVVFPAGLLPELVLENVCLFFPSRSFCSPHSQLLKTAG